MGLAERRVSVEAGSLSYGRRTYDVGHLPTKSVSELLSELDEALARSELPEMTILTRQQRMLRGRFVRHEGAAEQVSLLLQQTQPSGRVVVTYVPLEAVVAFTIHATDGDLHLLSFGQLLPVAC